MVSLSLIEALVKAAKSASNPSEQVRLRAAAKETVTKWCDSKMKRHVRSY